MKSDDLLEFFQSLLETVDTLAGIFRLGRRFGSVPDDLLDDRLGGGHHPLLDGADLVCDLTDTRSRDRADVVFEPLVLRIQMTESFGEAILDRVGLVQVLAQALHLGPHHLELFA